MILRVYSNNLKSPLISICLPNLNSEDFLNQRIESILAQSFKNWECIICDNFSDDESWNIISRFADIDDRFKIFQKSKNGMYSNWNNCLNLSSGEFIYIATSDDIMSKDCIEMLFRGFIMLPIASVISSIPWMIDINGNEMETGVCGDIEHRIAKEQNTPVLIDNMELFVSALERDRTPALSMTQLLIRKEVFSKISEFPIQFGSMGDWAWQMLTLANVKWGFVPEKLGSWRRHDKQATDSEQYVKNYLKTENEMVDWLINHRKFRKISWLFKLGIWKANRNYQLNSSNIYAKAGYLTKKFSMKIAHF